MYYMRISIWTARLLQRLRTGHLPFHDRTVVRFDWLASGGSYSSLPHPLAYLFGEIQDTIYNPYFLHETVYREWGACVSIM